MVRINLVEVNHDRFFYRRYAWFCDTMEEREAYRTNVLLSEVGYRVDCEKIHTVTTALVYQLIYPLINQLISTLFRVQKTVLHPQQ